MKKEQVDQIAREVTIPLIALNIPMPDVSGTRLRMNIHGVQVYQAAAKLYETMIHELKDEGQFLKREERRLPPETVARVMDRGNYRKLAEQWMKLER